MKNSKLDKIDNIVLKISKCIFTMLWVIGVHLFIFGIFFIVINIVCPNSISNNQILLKEAMPKFLLQVEFYSKFNTRDNFSFFLTIILFAAFLMVFEVPYVVAAWREKNEADSGLSLLYILAILEAIIYVFEYHIVWNEEIAKELIIKGIVVAVLLVSGNKMIIRGGSLKVGIVCNIAVAFCVLFILNYIFWEFFYFAIVLWLIYWLASNWDIVILSRFFR